MTEQSKFVLFHDKAATEINQRPNLTGEYRLAGDEVSSRLALWAGSDKNGKLYARGKTEPESVSAALRAKTDASEEVVMPKGLDLKAGEAVLFENVNATSENKQPKFYGYAREAARVVRFAGWERGNAIMGTAEPYRPSDVADVESSAKPEVA